MGYQTYLPNITLERDSKEGRFDYVDFLFPSKGINTDWKSR